MPKLYTKTSTAKSDDQASKNNELQAEQHELYDSIAKYNEEKICKSVDSAQAWLTNVQSLFFNLIKNSSHVHIKSKTLITFH